MQCGQQRAWRHQCLTMAMVGLPAVWIGCGVSGGTAPTISDGEDATSGALDSPNPEYSVPAESPLVTGRDRGFVANEETEELVDTGGESLLVVKDEILVSLRVDVTPREYTAIIEAIGDLGAAIVGEDAESLQLQLRISGDSDEWEILELLEGLDGVNAAWIRDASPLAPALEPHASLDSEGLWWMEHIGAPETWDYSYSLGWKPGQVNGEHAARICIIDDGYDRSRYDVAPGRVTVNAPPNRRGRDYTAVPGVHGTWMTSLAASDGDPELGLGPIGIAWAATVAVYDEWYRGPDQSKHCATDTADTSGLVEGIRWALRDLPQRRDRQWVPAVLNVSQQSTATVLQSFSNAQRRFWRSLLQASDALIPSRDALVIVAAGNAPGEIDLPLPQPTYSFSARVREQRRAQFERDLAEWRRRFLVVGATTDHSDLWENSARGQAVDLLAPGDEVGTGVELGEEVEDGCIWGSFAVSGTSAAAALASGTAAVVRSAAPDLSAEEVRAVLLSSVRRVSDHAAAALAPGVGILDAAEAMRRVVRSRNARVRERRQVVYAQEDAVQALDLPLESQVDSSSARRRSELDAGQFTATVFGDAHGFVSFPNGATVSQTEIDTPPVLDILVTNVKRLGIVRQTYDVVVVVSDDEGLLVVRQPIQIIVEPGSWGEATTVQLSEAAVNSSEPLIVGRNAHIMVSCVVAPASAAQSVVIDLSPLGGSAVQELTAGPAGRWTWSGSLIPPTAGVVPVSFTASGAGDTIARVQLDVTVGAAPTPSVGQINGTSWFSGRFYADNLDLSGTLGIPEAESLLVTIVGETEETYDYLTVNGTRYSGVIDLSFTVPGPSINVAFHSDFGINSASGVTITVASASP